jgi:hypothetical protein
MGSCILGIPTAGSQKSPKKEQFRNSDLIRVNATGEPARREIFSLCWLYPADSDFVIALLYAGLMGTAREVPIPGQE